MLRSVTTGSSVAYFSHQKSIRDERKRYNSRNYVGALDLSSAHAILQIYNSRNYVGALDGGGGVVSSTTVEIMLVP